MQHCVIVSGVGIVYVGTDSLKAEDTFHDNRTGAPNMVVWVVDGMLHKWAESQGASQELAREGGSTSLHA